MTLETQICRLIRHEGFLSWYMNGTSYKNRNMLVRSQNKVQKIKKWKPTNKLDFSWKIDLSGLGSWPHWQLLPKYGLNVVFHKKNIEFSSTISIFEVADFSIYWFLTLFCHETGSSSSKFNINRCSMKQCSRRFRFLSSRWWVYGRKVDLYRKYWFYIFFCFKHWFFMKNRYPGMEYG